MLLAVAGMRLVFVVARAPAWSVAASLVATVVAVVLCLANILTPTSQDASADFPSKQFNLGLSTLVQTHGIATQVQCPEVLKAGNPAKLDLSDVAMMPLQHRLEDTGSYPLCDTASEEPNNRRQGTRWLEGGG